MHVYNRQCEFVFGNGSKICSYMVNMFPIFMSHLSDCCKQPLKAHLPPPSPVEIPLPTQLTGSMRKSRMSKSRMRKYIAKKLELENLEFRDFLILSFIIVFDRGGGGKHFCDKV